MPVNSENAASTRDRLKDFKNKGRGETEVIIIIVIN